MSASKKRKNTKRSVSKASSSTKRKSKVAASAVTSLYQIARDTWSTATRNVPPLEKWTEAARAYMSNGLKTDLRQWAVRPLEKIWMTSKRATA